ncbi:MULTISPECIES: phage tail assembly chaperone [unclassified Pseudomonas]|uniref:phage tail assembly chaperone n=1 Tax=unclassified Pseudomonas TaxID=196821 RepID=UPI000A0D077A|nr:MULTISPECIES: phage tail assembly chaperone [unclassified Pseudomonas]SMF23499.1 Phage tail assembly chaperone protein [Pseudomonas sp. LAIL14HWK12:I11]SMR74286.1 Phage tail assembly chaperone protein [Pseudomonas sp. LAIL14HWK12:I10]SOD03543.1 Phage tail assembly chaperone protein [Pseudomonas sp. LAIL14HWK12:I8]
MRIFYRAIDGGFYFEEWFGPREILVPDPEWQGEGDDQIAPLVVIANPDCRLPAADELVEISAELHQELLAGEQIGLVIRADEQGFPVSDSADPASAEQLAELERLWRDTILTATDALVQRHRDEVEAGSDPTLTPEQYQELQAYRLALRDWPENEAFPSKLDRPAAPAWLAGQL